MWRVDGTNNEAPGLGIDIDEKQAARYPCDVEGGFTR